MGSRKFRTSLRYQEGGKERNARRMAAVREAEKRVSGWKKEGKNAGEVSRLLWAWNAENGSILGKRAINNILSKGV